MDPRIFHKVFCDQGPDPQVLAEAHAAVQRHSTNRVATLRKSFSTGFRYLFMPSPGDSRLGSTAPLRLRDFEAAYFEAYGDVVVRLGARRVVLHGSGWRSVNIVDGAIHHLGKVHAQPRARLGEHVSLRSLANRVKGWLRRARTGKWLIIEPQAGAAANLQFYRDGTWHRQELLQVLPPTQGGDMPCIVPWEDLANTLFNDALLMGDVRAMAPAGQDPQWERVRSEAPGIARRVVATLAQWPNWRPYDETGRKKGLHSWDRGNWANGYMPAAFAILAHVAGVQDEPWVRAAWKRLVTDFLDPATFPGPGHWIGRSTNHGAIIYGNLIGASILMDGRITDRTQTFIDDFRTVSASAFTDGFYMESRKPSPWRMPMHSRWRRPHPFPRSRGLSPRPALPGGRWLPVPRGSVHDRR